MIAPSIDAFSPKNHLMGFTTVTAVLRAAALAGDHDQHPRAVFERLDGSVGLVSQPGPDGRGAAAAPRRPRRCTQISRWDRLKDPLGVLAAFAEHVTLAEESHLVLAGPDVTAVADDPEGAEVFEEVETAWSELPRRLRRRVHLALLPMDDPDENAVIVNALQRRSDVVAQKSLAEGFGLTVAEAMWKGRPVVASGIGGIRDQIEDGRTGYLVEPRDLRSFGERVSGLLAGPLRRRAHGRGCADARPRPVPGPAAPRAVRRVARGGVEGSRELGVAGLEASGAGPQIVSGTISIAPHGHSSTQMPQPLQ